VTRQTGCKPTPPNLSHSVPKALISQPIAALSAVPHRDEAGLGNDRFITAVTLLQHALAISSGL